MTSGPARVIGIRDRGILAQGMRASGKHATIGGAQQSPAVALQPGLGGARTFEDRFRHLVGDNGCRPIGLLGAIKNGIQPVRNPVNLSA